MSGLSARLRATLEGEPDRVLRASLLVVAAFLVVMAFWPRAELLRAAVLAWVVLP